MPPQPAPDPTFVTPGVLRAWPLPSPQAGAGKEQRGRVLVVGGSAETPGAALLAALAALRTGAGKLQIATVSSVAPYLAVDVPEGLIRGLAQTSDGAIDPAAAGAVADLASQAQAVLIGPGLTGVDDAAALVTGLLQHVTDATVVLDALGLAAVTESAECLVPLGGNVVLTPNVQELAILLDVTAEDVQDDPGGAAAQAAERTGAVVTVGGGQSWIVHPDGRAWVEESGSAGLGTSGSGDVLAGTVAGLAARGAEPAQAALWATYVHGRAGDRLAAKVGRLGFLARELIAEIPTVLSELEA